MMEKISEVCLMMKKANYDITCSALCHLVSYLRAPTYLSHLWSQVKDPEERARECSDDTLDYTNEIDPDRDPWMRENEDIQCEDTC